MSRRSWYLLIGLAFAVHNGEEALSANSLLQFLQYEAPSFLRDFYAGVSPFQLQPNLIIITGAGFLIAAVAVWRSATAASAYLMISFAAVLCLNGLFHIGLSIASEVVMPGLVTALLFTLPASMAMLMQAYRDAWAPRTFFWMLIPVAMVIHGPVLAGLLRMTL